MIDVPLAVAEPWLACVETATLVAVPPVMLRVIVSLDELKATVALTLFATGAAGLTVIETVAAADVPTSLDAVYWKLSEPENPVVGV